MRSYTTGILEITLSPQPVLMLFHRKLLRMVDGGTLCVGRLNSRSRNLNPISISEAWILRLLTMRTSQKTLRLSSWRMGSQEVCRSSSIPNVCLLTRILGSHESYVRAVLAPAVAPKSEGGLGFRDVVVNFRGCKGIPITSPATDCSFFRRRGCSHHKPPTVFCGAH